MLVSCDGGTSSNTETRRVENNSQSATAEEGELNVNGATIEVDPDGNPIIVDDPAGGTEATRNPDGTISVTSGDGSTVILNPEDEQLTNDNP